MAKSNDPKYKMFCEFSEQWETSFNSGKFDDAIGTGIKAYLTFRKSGDKKWSDGSLGLLAVTIPSAMAGKEVSTPGATLSCSFCAQPGTKETLVAGPEAFICASCAALSNRILNEKSKNKNRMKKS